MEENEHNEWQHCRENQSWAVFKGVDLTASRLYSCISF